MRIAYLSADLGVPVFGTKGASVHVRELCQALASLGHEVEILTARAGGPRPAGFDVPVHEIPAEGGDLRDRRALHAAAALRRRGLALLQDFSADVIYERYALFGTAGSALALELELPFLVEVNAPLSDEQATYRKLALDLTARRLERGVLRSADRVIVVSRWLRRWAIELGVEARRVAVLPNGVDPDRFKPTDAGGVVRARLGLDGPIVGFLGTLKPWHDVPALIHAVARLGQAGRRAQLLVVGDGPERAALEELARSERVEATFTGAVPHEQVPDYAAALDVAVAPYARDDGFYFSPLKLVEYLAAARPVVAADIGEIGHCVRPGETGFLYRPGDVAGLAGSLAEALADPAAAASLGAAGRAHVCKEHTWEENARAVVELAHAELSARQAV
ncbi:MAG: glycosyltransferase [Actinomycetota bacterium]|nr:glycosyltransferase [Actinomycetota bacterium]